MYNRYVWNVGWFSIVFGTVLFFLGAAMAFSLNFTGAWAPDTWRLVSDQSMLNQLIIFILFNSDFFGVLTCILGLVTVGQGVLIVNKFRLKMIGLRMIALIFLSASFLIGGGFLFFSQGLMVDSSFRFLTPSIQKGVLGILVILGLVVTFISGLPWAIFLYVLRRDRNE